MKMSTRTRIPALFLLGCLGLLLGCSKTHPRRDPVGERFPLVRGTSLQGDTKILPDDVAGEPTLILVGFAQESQFDIDRWLLGLHQAEVEIRVYEVPTIPGLVPRMISSRIDQGMRSGIPQEDWGGVVTVYGDGDAIALFLGNENPLPARVVLLDRNGVVVFFHDRGYSVGSLEQLITAVGKLQTRSMEPDPPTEKI